MKIEKVKNRGIMFSFNSPGWDLNIYLIKGKKYNYLVDTGLGSLCIDPVKEYLGQDSKPLIVIITHYHWDHVWGNGSLREYMIISHKLCREMMESKWDDMLRKNKEYCSGKVEMCLPNLVFEKEFYFPDDKIRIVYTPGHTIDSISVVDEYEKVIHIGDNIGDTVEDIVASIYSTNELYKDTISRYQDMDFDTCISGHNVVLGKEAIEKISSLL
jgi:glyoxylase-like metal-dependent hydrolase (beta-lactamase superfamily II)